MRACLPFMGAYMGRKLCPVMFAQDAAGGGPCTPQGPNGSFSLVCGLPKIGDLCTCFHLIQIKRRTSGSFQKVLAAATSAAEAAGTGDFIPRTALPFSIFAALWFQLCAGRWGRLDHINLGEGRAALRIHHLVAKIPYFRGLFGLDVGDHQAANGALERCRSPIFQMSRLCFQKDAFEAIYDFRLRHPWAPSAAQPEDWGTRDGLDATIAATRRGEAPVVFLWFSGVALSALPWRRPSRPGPAKLSSGWFACVPVRVRVFPSVPQMAKFVFTRPWRSLAF